jgi:hypothetical protein
MYKGGEKSPSFVFLIMRERGKEGGREGGREVERGERGREGGESELFNFRRCRLMGLLRDKLLLITIIE